MNMKEIAWNVFNKSGSIDAYLLYKEESDYLMKAGNDSVCEYTGNCDPGNQGGGE